MGRSKKIVDNSLIVDKALELIERNGYDSFSTRKLAAELGISAMTLYNYFDNRDAIVSRAILKGYDIFWADVPEDLHHYTSRSRRPLQVYKMLAEYLFGFGTTHPSLYAFLFNTQLASLKNDPEVLRRYSSAFRYVSEYALPGTDLDRVHGDLYLFQVLSNALVLNTIRNRSGMTADKFRMFVDRAYALIVEPHEASFPYREPVHPASPSP